MCIDKFNTDSFPYQSVQKIVLSANRIHRSVPSAQMDMHYWEQQIAFA